MKTLDDILAESEALKPKLADAERELAQARKERDEARLELARLRATTPAPVPTAKPGAEAGKLPTMTERCLAANGKSGAR